MHQRTNMDLLKPGLPKKTLRRLRATNTISSRLGSQIQQLDAETQAVLRAGHRVSGPVQDVFADFYYALQTARADPVPATLLLTLIALLERLPQPLETPLAFSGGKNVEISPHTPAPESGDALLTAIMEKYCVVIALDRLTNALVYKTIIAKGHAAYWASVQSLSSAQWLYGLQTLPVRAYHLITWGLANTAQTVSAANGQSPLDTIRGFCRSVWRVTQDTFAAMANADFIAQRARWRVAAVPLRALGAEVRAKAAAVDAEVTRLYCTLGSILHGLPASSLDGVVSSRGLVAQLHEVQTLIAESAKPDMATAPPNFATRYWPVLLAALAYGPATSRDVWRSRRAIVAWIQHNLVDSAVGFWKNWVVAPAQNMLGILRNDSSLAIASKESLQADLDSLERMVKDYLTDIHADYSAQDVALAVQQGDLTMVMSQYENELRTPYRSILSGLLVRLILIQVQKTKVDGDMAINGIDKLLKLQQLLFGMLSVLPSLLVLYQAYRALTRDSSMAPASQRLECRRSVNQIARLVTEHGSGFKSDQDKQASAGRLFVEVLNLTLLAHAVVPRVMWKDFVADLNHLTLASSSDPADATRTIDRIWKMYTPFFRK